MHYNKYRRYTPRKESVGIHTFFPAAIGRGTIRQPPAEAASSYGMIGIELNAVILELLAV